MRTPCSLLLILKMHHPIDNYIDRYVAETLSYVWYKTDYTANISLNSVPVLCGNKISLLKKGTITDTPTSQSVFFSLPHYITVMPGRERE